jgi:hypothetical protein
MYMATVIVKDFMYYGFSLFANNWVRSQTIVLMVKLTAKGATSVFNVFGGVSVATAFLSLPMYLFGKRLRSWWYSANS